jgi:hypothetical protein
MLDVLLWCGLVIALWWWNWGLPWLFFKNTAIGWPRHLKKIANSQYTHDAIPNEDPFEGLVALLY